MISHDRYSNLKRFLVLRYLTALSLVFCVLLSTLVIFTHQISLSEHDAYIINISGMQRMLSQRIALLTQEINNAQDTRTADSYAAEMTKAVQKMILNHGILTGREKDSPVSVEMSEPIRALYYSEGGIDQHVQKYTSAAQSLLETYKNQGLEAAQKSPFAAEIFALERSGLLQQLNQAVSQYQAEATDKISQLKKIETVIFFAGVLLLVLEVLFIFHPMAREISKKHEELASINEIKDKELMEFAYRISHDLRAPVVSSLGLTQVAENAANQGDSATANQAFSYIKKALTDLETLIDDLVTLTKMKMVEIPDEEVFVPDLIEGTLQKVRNMPEAVNIDIQMQTDISQSHMTKKLLLAQIIDNLISNAVKYSDAKEEKSFIHVTASQKGKVCTIRVSDNGIGIPESCREKVFGLFERFHPGKSFGSGLGLYLVAQNARILKGTAEYSPREKGSEFRITIPVTTAEKSRKQA